MPFAVSVSPEEIPEPFLVPVSELGYRTAGPFRGVSEVRTFL